MATYPSQLGIQFNLKENQMEMLTLFVGALSCLLIGLAALVV